MEKYNLSKLIKADCYDFRKSPFFIYKKSKKFLGINIRREGVYGKGFLEGYYGKYGPITNHSLIDNIIYENPEVNLYFEKNYSKTYYFDSYEEAKKFFEDITSGSKWIK